MKYISFSFLERIVIISSAVVLFSFAFLPQALAQQYPPLGIISGTTIELDGYAWSSTIGWISLNCKTGSAAGGNVCATSDYQVVINSSGNVSGYAWSSNIGWIRFGGLSQYPVDAGNPGIDGVATNNPARVTGTYPALTFAGWARACAGTASSADSCNNMTARSDGWDGWISLKGNTYSITAQSGGTINGPAYAWGSTNVGWIDMAAQVKWSTVSATLTGTSCIIARGAGSCNTTLAWKFNPNNIKNPSVYRFSPSPVVVIGSTASSATDAAVTLAYGSYTYKADTGGTTLASKSLSASCAVGDRYSATTSKCEFNATSTVDITSFKASSKVVRIGSSVDLSWIVEGVPDMSKCKLVGPGVPANYMKSSIPLADSLAVPNITSYSRYALTCGTVTGTTTATVNVEVVPSVIEM